MENLDIANMTYSVLNGQIALTCIPTLHSTIGEQQNAVSL